jgi:hypothetical protein
MPFPVGMEWSGSFSNDFAIFDLCVVRGRLHSAASLVLFWLQSWSSRSVDNMYKDFPLSELSLIVNKNYAAGNFVVGFRTSGSLEVPWCHVRLMFAIVIAPPPLISCRSRPSLSWQQSSSASAVNIGQVLDRSRESRFHARSNYRFI